MKKGKVKILHLGHKNGRTILNAGDLVTENDVDNFDALVSTNRIELIGEKTEAPKKEAKKEVKKSE